MGVRWFALFVFFLLASQIQYVSCPDTDSCQDHSSPDMKDHWYVFRKHHKSTTDCTNASSEEMILSWVSSTMSCFIFFVPIKRVLRLQSSNQDVNAAQPLFRWSFFFGLQAYSLWSCYFLPFYQYPQCPGFPILLACVIGAITNAVLLLVVISKAPVVGWDSRLPVGVVSIIVFGCGLNFHQKQQIIGWVAVAFGVLSHFCRIASTDYYANFNLFLCVASAVGGVDGFLWLSRPQVGSYIIACLRGLEALLWLSRLAAPILSKIEGRIFAPQPDPLEYELYLW